MGSERWYYNFAHSDICYDRALRIIVTPGLRKRGRGVSDIVIGLGPANFGQ